MRDVYYPPCRRRLSPSPPPLPPHSNKMNVAALGWGVCQRWTVRTKKRLHKETNVSFKAAAILKKQPKVREVYSTF